MRPSRLALLGTCMILVGSTACSLALTAATPTPTSQPRPKPTSTTQSAATASPAAAATPTTAPSSAVAAASPSSFCSDNRVSVLIGNLKSAVLTSNGPLLASLVSPTHGMDARLFRNGRVVNYDSEHAKFLFVSTFVVDWGLAPASGLDTRGSFHDLVLPALVDVFSTNFTLSCDQIQVGGTTYRATWPYTGIDFYSAHYPGTAANGNLDWHTWLVGVDYVGSKPYLYAILQFFWEP